MKFKFGVDSFIWAEDFKEKDLWIIEKAKEQMEQSGSKFLGIILNKVSESVATYGDYGDYGNYGKRDRKRTNGYSSESEINGTGHSGNPKSYGIAT